MKTIYGHKAISLGFIIGLLANNYVFAGPGAVCAGVNTSLAECMNSGGEIIPTYYANSPQLKKFVDTLPLVGPSGKNNLGNFIPVAEGDTTSYPGSVYYELAIVEYTQKMHTDLPKETTLRGYVQIDRDKTNSNNTLSSDPLALKYPDGSPIYIPQEKGLVNGVWDHTLVLDNNGNPVLVPAIAKEKPLYFGPLIVATKGTATRIKFTNLLPQGHASNGNRNGDIFLPVDETLPGAGNTTTPSYTFPQNRTTIHLHGGDSPWISDGTPHQWFTPEKGLEPSLTKGSRFSNVPDMPYPGDTAQTVYWPNDQSERFMWYHDHTFGLTRQNAYAGEAAPYFIQDPIEDAALASSLPTDILPIVIQDKTFVANDIAIQDTKWNQTYWGTPGDLWYPHVYEPNVLNTYSDGSPRPSQLDNPAGRWDYGPTAENQTASLPLPTGEYGQASVGPEAYMDTPLVNGVAYPTITVDPKAYRARFLNAANDRYFNLSLWKADSNVITGDSRNNTEIKMIPEKVPFSIEVNNPGSNYVSPIVTISDNGGYGKGATASATLQMGKIDSITITNPGSSYTNPIVTIADSKSKGKNATATVKTQPGRLSGIPNPLDAGPSITMFSTEGGLLPVPVVYNPSTMSFSDTTETGGGLYLAPAERAEAVIDFSQYPGKTLILYNDSTAPVPDGDDRYDYYTGNPDLSPVGGAPSTLPGYGPNTRTVMQIKVNTTLGTPAYNTTALATVLKGVYATRADSHIENVVADGKLTTNTMATWLSKHSTANIKTKTIEGGFDINFGRLIANFGIELPLLGNPTPLAYIDSPTDIVEDGKIQYWIIKNHDADNHPIHFHLFNVQVIARVDPSGSQLLTNPLPNEAGWKEDVQNWPQQWTIVALKPKTPLLPFGLPDSVRLMDPTLNPGDSTNTSLGQNYDKYSINNIPFAFQQIDLATGSTKTVTNELQNFGWEYVYHCHILGHEENDLMRPMVFHPKTVVKPAAPTKLAVNAGNLTWVDTTPISNLALTKGNPANEIGFRVEYSTDGGKSYQPLLTNSINNLIKIPNNAPGNLDPSPTGTKINSAANTSLFSLSNLASVTNLPSNKTYVRVVAVNQAGEVPSAGLKYK